MSEMVRSSIGRLAPLVVIALGFALVYWLGLEDYLSLQYFADSRAALSTYVDAHILPSALAFVALYAIAVAFVFPAPTILTIAGGFLFGWALGGLFVVIGATIGASALFLAARTAFGGFLRRKARGAVRDFAEGFRNDAFTYLLVMRLTPLLPFTILNIAPALFDISLRSFVLATFIGIIPGSLVYAFLGSGLDSALMMAGSVRDLSVADLVTTEMTLALVGLCALSLLGLVLKRWIAAHGGEKARQS